MPRQLGPSTIMPVSAAMRATSACAAMPSSPPSANPAEKITAAPTSRAARPRTASSTAAPGMASTAASTPLGSASIDLRHARPAISSRFGLIRWMSPEKPCRSRLRSTELPSAPGFSDAPTIATDRALSSRSSLWMRGRSIASTVICSGLLLRPIVSTESGLVGLLVDDLADAFLAPVIVVAVGGFLRADQINLGIVIAHHRDAAYRVLGRLQCDRVLLEQDGRDLGHAALEIGERQSFVDPAPIGGGPAVDILAHHRMVHRLAERQQLDRDLGRPAARQNAPDDLAEAELRFLGGEGEDAGAQRAITAPDAPAIDHRDGRLLVPAQAAPPAIALALRLARRAQTLGLGLV